MICPKYLKISYTKLREWLYSPLAVKISLSRTLTLFFSFNLIKQIFLTVEKLLYNLVLVSTMLLLLLLLSRFSRVRLCATPETAAHQPPPSLGFSRQEHWSGLPFPSPMHESESEVAQSCLT